MTALLDSELQPLAQTCASLYPLVPAAGAVCQRAAGFQLENTGKAGGQGSSQERCPRACSAAAGGAVPARHAERVPRGEPLQQLLDQILPFDHTAIPCTGVWQDFPLCGVSLGVVSGTDCIVQGGSGLKASAGERVVVSLEVLVVCMSGFALCCVSPVNLLFSLPHPAFMLPALLPHVMSTAFAACAGVIGRSRALHTLHSAMERAMPYSYSLCVRSLTLVQHHMRTYLQPLCCRLQAGPSRDRAKIGRPPQAPSFSLCCRSLGLCVNR